MSLMRDPGTEPLVMISGDVMKLHRIIYAEREAHAAEVAEAAALRVELAKAKADLAAAREDVALLEKWLNEDPEMRLAEVLVGESYRWCVRLEQLVFDEPGSVKFSAEAGTFSEALHAAIDSARAGGGR